MIKVTFDAPSAVTSINGCFEPGKDTKAPSAGPPTAAVPTEAPPTMNAQPTPATPTNAQPTPATPTNAQPSPVSPTSGPPSTSVPTPDGGTPTLAPPTTGPPSPTTPAPTTLDGCANVILDFDTYPDGTPLPGGKYVEKEWAAYGLTLSATGGFLDFPRLFDTSDIGNPNFGDADLGSPNERCTPSGPGVGEGGEPGEPGENCVPQGNVLIIQEDNGKH